MLALFLSAAASAPLAYAQALPQFTAAGVVNAGSYGQPISPGSIASIFGTNLATSTASASETPLPIALAGTSVTVNGVPAPLFYVSANQINFQVPWSTPFGLYSAEQASIAVTTEAGTSSPVTVPVFETGPAILSADSSGCGQAAALNVKPDGTTSSNSTADSVAPGDYISLFGIGFGMPYSPPPDGTPPSSGITFQMGVGVNLAGEFLPVSYEGLAPALVGVDQVNFQIPTSSIEGCTIPVSVSALPFVGPTLSLSIHSGRGQCVDPPARSYGDVTLTKTFTSANEGNTTEEAVAAAFPYGPNAIPPALPAVSPDVYANVTIDVPTTRACPAVGKAHQSAGVMQLKGAQQTIQVTPSASINGTDYLQALPEGFLAAGNYTVSTSGDISFTGALTVPTPIQIETPLPPGTAISQTEPFVIRWWGGRAGDVVKVRMISSIGLWSTSTYGSADAASGAFTFAPVCFDMSGGRYCTFGIPASGDLTVTLEVSPSSGTVDSVPAQGLTDAVRLIPVFRYVFKGLTL